MSYLVILSRALHHQTGVKALTRAGLSVCGGLAPLLLISQAHATGRVALAYDAAVGCSSETDFKEAVERRGGNFSGPGAPGSAWALRVSILRDAGGFHGTLQATNDDATSALREVHGATCPEVVDALAVVSATALNPQGESKSAIDEQPTRKVAAAAPATSPVSAASPEPAPTTSAFSEGRLRATRALINAQLPVQAGTLRLDYARALTLFAGAQFGMVPNTVMPRYDLSFDGASFVTTPGGNTFMHGAIPRLRLSYAGQAKYETHDTSSSVNVFTFALGACWSPIYDTRGWVALLCGEYGAGFVNIVSKNLQGAQIQNKTKGLGFAGLGLETRYNLGSLFQVGLKLGVDVMVDSFSAERADGSRIFESSQFVGYGMLGFGVHF
ncbi:MAG TPA: hypothetical protein VER12_02090 [Polyangiaceae bacterium]|nr:hypothetical protein [Polyangiaceae bacterium]